MSHGYFFAVGEDIVLLARHVESKLASKYTLASIYPSRGLLVVDEVTAIPGIGVADGDQHIICSRYLVTERETAVHCRRIKRNDGTVVFNVDQISNPDSIALTPAGLWRDKVVIAGRVMASSRSKVAQKLMRLYRAALNKYFVKVNDTWVGPEALRLFRDGGRLCWAVQSPGVYDLRETTEVSDIDSLNTAASEPLEVITMAELIERLRQGKI